MMRCGIWLVALRGRGQAKENIAVSTDGLVPIKRITNWELYLFHDYERFKEFSFFFFFISSIFFLGISRYREAGLVLKQGGYIYRKANTEREKKKKRSKREKFVSFSFGVVGEFTSMICLLFFYLLVICCLFLLLP